MNIICLQCAISLKHLKHIYIVSLKHRRPISSSAYCAVGKTHCLHVGMGVIITVSDEVAIVHKTKLMQCIIQDTFYSSGRPHSKQRQVICEHSGAFRAQWQQSPQSQSGHCKTEECM